MGDFNCILYTHEKVGGNPPPVNKLSDFQDCVNDAGLIDLPSNGFLFTWSNLRADYPIKSKIDRAMCNSFWLDTYSSSSYKVPSPLSSDHSPLILSLNNQRQKIHRFIFQNYWVNLPNFKSEVQNAWSKYVSGDPMMVLLKKLQAVKEALKKIKIDHSPLEQQVSYLKAEQELIMGLVEKDPSNLIYAQSLKEINNKYSEAVKMESLWVKQRAKITWLTNVDDDLKFLYSSIKERRNSHQISSLQVERGIITSHSDLATEICLYYSSLFNKHNSREEPCMDTPIGTNIHHSLLKEAGDPITDAEIIEALHSINEDKTPGPDGFTSKFFTNCWEIVGKQFLLAAHHFFKAKKLPAAFKHSAITLIPKSKHSNIVADYRPISLCNTFYKVIAKVIAN